MDYAQEGRRRRRPGCEMTMAPTAGRDETPGAELVATDSPPATTRVDLARRRAAVRAVSDDLLRPATAGPSGDPQRSGDVAAAWLSLASQHAPSVR
jgi:hypothetical protein